MPEPGMGANNDHSSTSTGNSFGGGGDSSSSSSTGSSSTSSDNTTADNLSSSNTTADNLSGNSSGSGSNNSPTTADSLASSPTTAESLSNTTTHSYDEVPSVAVSRYSPPDPVTSTDNETTSSVTSSQIPDGVPNEYAELFGAKPTVVGGVDAVWANGDGTYSSSDGSTYDPATGKGTYDVGEDSFAVTRTSSVASLNVEIDDGINIETDFVTTTQRQRHPDRVRTSEAMAVVEHDPHNFTQAHGARAAFDYYSNPNLDSVRDSALMEIASRTGMPVAGRYPGENMMYMGVVPLAAHLTRSTLNRQPVRQIDDVPALQTPGTFRGQLDSLTASEKSFVQRELAAGRNVEAIPTGTGRTPDFQLDGQRVELKTLEGITSQSSNGLSSAIANRTMNGRGQAADIVVDGRSQAGLTEEIAERGVRRAFGADNRTGGKIDSIRVIGDNFDITVQRKP